MASRIVCCLHVWSLVFSVLFINFRNAVSDDDFYGILGVSRNANSDSIRRAYRRLAKEWHPDKNTDSNAQEKFIKINEAYETLSDPKKRENYDRYGQAQAPSDWEQEHDFFHDSGFMFFNDMPFQFQSNWQHRDFTTSNFYKKTILPDSFKKPYLLQIVSDWCLNCAAVEEIWEAASRDLKSLGVGIGCVNRNIDPQLAKDLGARKLPDFVGIINGKLYHFTGAVTVEKLKNFVSGLFPKDLVPEVTNSTLSQFLHHWYDNKPRALLFTTKSEAPLLLKIVSFKYRAFVGIGYLQLTKPHNGETRVKFGAAKNEPSFAVFKEDTSRPQILLKGSELKTGTLDEVISMNLYLDFPRISSKAMLETTCPQGKFVSERSLCVILFIDNIKEIENGHPLLTMSKDRAWLLKRIRFGYVNQKVQHDFASSIKMSEKTRTFCKDNKLSRKVAVLWHLKDREVKYSWLENGWCEPQDVSRLAAMLNWIHSGKVEFEMSAVVAELVNEHGKSFGPWLLDLWDDVVYYSLHYVNWSGNLPALSLIITFTFVFMVSCLFPVVSENESTLKNNGQHQRPNRANVFGLVQLNSQTQNELIHKAKQGRLVVVLLLDATSESEAVRSPIVQTFAGITRYYLRENIFTFGWLSIQDNIAWCNEVMKVQTFGEVKPGTVLALNGAKKYLSIFKVQRQNQDDFRYDSRNLFDDSEDEDGENSSMVFREDKCTEKRIADALSQQFPNWLEKLLQGMLPRVKLDSWPRMECDK